MSASSQGIDASRAREAARKARDLTRPRARSIRWPAGKLADWPGEDPLRCELFW